jgi:hypothetical protein
MRSVLHHRLLLTAILLFVALQSLASQEQGETYGLPGSHFLQQDWARIGPLLRQATLKLGPESFLRKTSAWNFSIGDSRSWWATDLTNSSSPFEYSVSSTCRAVGSHCYVFVEDSLWNVRVTQAAVDSMRIAFDERTPMNAAKGIYELEGEFFGDPPDAIDHDPKIVILMLNIRDGFSGSGGYVAGYFYSINQFLETVVQSQLGANRHSNEAEIYYVDANPTNLSSSSGLTLAMSTTAHEFQHMIHFNYDGDEISFVNEGMSESASKLCGYPLRSPSAYVANTNVNFLAWNATGNVLVDYSRAAAFSWYLVEQVGNTVTKQIVQNTANGIAGYDAAFTIAGMSRRFPDYLTDFGIALAMNDVLFDSRYGFTAPVVTTPTPHRLFSSSWVSAVQDSVKPFGAYYVRYSTNDSLRLAMTFPSTLRVSAIATGSTGKSVSPITSSTQFVPPGFGTGYSTLWLSITNTSNAIQSFSLSSVGGDSIASAITIENLSSATPTSFMLLPNYPNPFNPSTIIPFSLPNESHVSLSVCDVWGRQVALLEDRVFESGRHVSVWNAEGHASGTYFIRFQAGSHHSFRKVLYLR